MATKFFPAPEVQQIGRELIVKYHTHLNEYGVHIEFIFRNDVPTKNGRDVWGTARKASGLTAFLSNQYRYEVEENRPQDDDVEPFFIITISRPVWKDLKHEQRVALVDHELMHCKVELVQNEEPKLVIVGHDFEGFYKEIERYGLWRKDAEFMAEAMKEHLQQPELPLEKPKKAPGRKSGIVANIGGGVVH